MQPSPLRPATASLFPDIALLPDLWSPGGSLGPSPGFLFIVDPSVYVTGKAAGVGCTTQLLTQCHRHAIGQLFISSLLGSTSRVLTMLALI